MKKKEIISIIIIAILLAAILFGTIYLSSRHRLDDKGFVPSIIGTNSQTMGKYLYFDKNGTLMRYDSMTDSVTKLCGHLSSGSNCILEKVGSSVQLYNNRLYFDYLTDDVFGETNAIAYYDIISGKTHLLNIEIYRTSKFFISDGYIYYTHSNNICRIPADGGKSEILIESNGIEKMFMAADGKIYVSCVMLSFSSSFPSLNTGYIYSYDVETLVKEEVFKFTTATSSPIIKALYCDGKIYLQISDASGLDAASSLIISDHEYLYRIDTKTHETVKISDTNINDFYLTENNIYYIPYEERKVYAPDVYFSDENGMYDVLKSADIHICDLDGGNDHIIYTNPDIALESVHIINGKLFGLFVGTVPGIEANDFYASLNLENGEIKEVKIPN